MYYWQLEKYKGQKTRYRCPSCNKPHEYTRYIDAKGNYAPYEYGVCNRVEKCGYSKYPNKEESTSGEPIQAYIEPIPDTIEADIYLDKYPNIDNDNNLIQYLSKYYPIENIIEVFNLYYVRTEGNKIVYPYADKRNQLRYVKVMEYDNDGHRSGGIFAPFTGNYKACLFGLHLVGSKRNCIVESEKTALICALEFPEHTWLSTGGIQNLSRLKDITEGELFPDKGKAFELWNEKKGNFTINRIIEDVEALSDGDDLADYILKNKELA